ncbi:MAG: peptidoglycan DD-metalloendopeptidase family protein [Pleurocapsa minor GSE-CHR-MK-17-07R]|jgi:murein DD-endopeptidase MepM/ murein hydrolase activator NlpD|nr:peptidoglycan DD-metalloendopeptidase family protein [Pleurocapsa minor GSE-CHR-MK 17-07R]
MAASLPAVPKPASAGAGQDALARTKRDFAYIRNGPGTNYKDVGQLRNLTLVKYYPATRAADGWVWVEQSNVAGWTSTSVVTFDAAPAPIPPPTGASPYQGAVALWHWRADVVPQNSIDELARSIKTNAPYVTQVFVKTSDYGSVGTNGVRTARWMGVWDSKRALAIDGPGSIDNWVNTLRNYNLEFHAWCVPKGLDLNAETDLIIQACNRPGVKSMILDVEPYKEYWQGGQALIRPYMERIRRSIPANFHIGLSVDPRIQHYETIFPREWQPFVNSVHPQSYWTTMDRDLEGLLAEVYSVWSPFGKPIIPVLQGDAPSQEIASARSVAISKHRAVGLSYWRIGVIGPVEYSALNKPMSDTSTPPGQPPQVIYGPEFIVKTGDANYSDFSYTGNRQMVEFTNLWGWKALYKTTTARAAEAAARWSPRLTKAAQYDVSVFIPGRNSTTTQARYKVNGVVGAGTEVVVPIDQSRYSNQWVSLGVFQLDPRVINSGTVFLNDLTGESDKRIAFDAVRWQEVMYVDAGGGGPVPVGYADGFDQPMGTEAERASTTVWGGGWKDVSPYAKAYLQGDYHTGADLNLNTPRWDADANAPVYAPASGTVTFAASLPIWGNIIVIKHDPLAVGGKVVYTRFAHVSNMIVKVGDRVRRGQQVCQVGNAFGRFAYHLHFDIVTSSILETSPGDWPGRDLNRLKAHYVDPRLFIQQNRPRR